MVVQVHAARQLLVALVALVALGTWFLLEMWHQLRRCSMQMRTNVDDVGDVGARRELPLDEASGMTAPPSSEDRDRLARHGDTGNFRVARCLGARSDCLSKEAHRTRPDNVFIFVPAFVPGSASRLRRTLIRRTTRPNRPSSGRSDRTVRRASAAKTLSIGTSTEVLTGFAILPLPGRERPGTSVVANASQAGGGPDSSDPTRTAAPSSGRSFIKVKEW